MLPGSCHPVGRLTPGHPIAGRGPIGRAAHRRWGDRVRGEGLLTGYPHPGRCGCPQPPCRGQLAAGSLDSGCTTAFSTPTRAPGARRCAARSPRSRWWRSRPHRQACVPCSVSTMSCALHHEDPVGARGDRGPGVRRPVADGLWRHVRPVRARSGGFHRVGSERRAARRRGRRRCGRGWSRSRWSAEPLRGHGPVDGDGDPTPSRMAAARLGGEGGRSHRP